MEGERKDPKFLKCVAAPEHNRDSYSIKTPQHSQRSVRSWWSFQQLVAHAIRREL